MSIAAPEQILLRIVFLTYMFFSGSQIQKKYFPGGRCVIDIIISYHHHNNIKLYRSMYRSIQNDDDIERRKQ